MNHSPMARHFDVVIIGAGASGLMCAAVAGARGRRVLVLDHANKVGKKILMSGGGRCNFTNRHVGPDNYLCRNPHFVKSALSRYTPADFIDLVERHGIAYHERSHGQLFCDHSAKDILRMLLDECRAGGVRIENRSPVSDLRIGEPHQLFCPQGPVSCESLVIATGGCSIPTLGATDFGMALARSLGMTVHPPRPALVPLTLSGRTLERVRDLSGIALEARVTVAGHGFKENLLFTHRGLSGPAVLQASSYWEPGLPVEIDLLPELDLAAHLQRLRRERPKMALKTWLGQHLTRRVAQRWCECWVEDKTLEQLTTGDIEAVEAACKRWTVWPSGTEGYRTAEVTVGGVDTEALSSKTMACRDRPGLYFIGEVMDVTGHLGGYNFQWAWSSGHAAGQCV